MIGDKTGIDQMLSQFADVITYPALFLPEVQLGLVGRSVVW